MADVHITLLYPSYNFDRENASGEMPETHCNLFKMIGGGAVVDLVTELQASAPDILLEEEPRKRPSSLQK
jgi:hypothetical protein